MISIGGRGRVVNEREYDLESVYDGMSSALYILLYVHIGGILSH